MIKLLKKLKNLLIKNLVKTQPKFQNCKYKKYIQKYQKINYMNNKNLFIQ